MVRVVNVAKKMGIPVYYDSSVRCGGLYYRAGYIVLNPRRALERQIITVLHELGHASVTKNQRRTRFNKGYFTFRERGHKNMLHILEEEIYAWHRAWQIGKRHCLGVNKALFEYLSTECLASYVRLAAKKKYLGRRRRFKL